MNPQVPNELISAYFDGEASPEERAAVENLLDESTATRRELDEISQLSALLHSFPRESAPAALVTNVQRQTDQMPLVAPATSTPAALPRSLRREWTAAALGALVTAASLMLMANLVDQPGMRGLQRMTRTESATAKSNWDKSPAGIAMNTASTDGTRDSDDDQRLGMKKFGLGGDFGAAREAEKDGLPLPTVASKSSDGLAQFDKSSESLLRSSNSALKGGMGGGGEPFFEAQQNRNAAMNSLQLDNSFIVNNGTIMLTNGDFLNGLKVGQVFQFVPQPADPGSNVAVVDLEVLDIERGVDEVQVLLSRHSIKPRRPGQMNERDRQNFEKLSDQSKSGSNEIIAVYTYGPGEKLAQTLQDIELHRDLFVSWSSQPPVQLPNSVEWADLNSDKAGAKDAGVPADRPVDAKQSVATTPLAAQAKEESLAEDNMDTEAELVLQTLLARGSYSNNSGNTANNFNDSNPVSGPQEQAGNAKLPGRGFGDRASRVKPSDPDSKRQLAETKNAPPAATQAAGPASNAKAGADQKLAEATKKKDVAPQAGYQKVLRVANDASNQLADQVPPLNRPQVQNVDRSQNMNRRSGTNTPQQQADAYSNTRVDANQAVKVLFVLHTAQNQSAVPAAAAPVGKPSP